MFGHQTLAKGESYVEWPTDEHFIKWGLKTQQTLRLKSIGYSFKHGQLSCLVLELNNNECSPKFEH